jgi:predicted RecA/RadA family phage recombinase
MATNYVQDGVHVEFTAPSGGVNGNAVVILNNMFGVALLDAVSGATSQLGIGGVWDIAKPNAVSTSMAVGAFVYYDATNAVATASATSNTKLGVVVRAASNTDTTVRVRFNSSF